MSPCMSHTQAHQSSGRTHVPPPPPAQLHLSVCACVCVSEAVKTNSQPMCLLCLSPLCLCSGNLPSDLCTSVSVCVCVHD